MSPISDNRNLSSDKPVDPKKIERENAYVQSGRKNRQDDRYREGGTKPSPESAVDAANAQSQPQGFVDSRKEKEEPAFGAKERPDIFSSMRRSKPQVDADPESPKEPGAKNESKTAEDQSEFKPAETGGNAKERKTQKTALQTPAAKTEKKTAEKPKETVEPVKTVFGGKDYVDKKAIKYNLWKSDDLRGMTKLGRNDRAGLAQEFFPDRRLVRKEDVKKAIRGIESGKIKPPASLGSGRTGRIRTTNVLRGLIGEKPKKIY